MRRSMVNVCPGRTQIKERFDGFADGHRLCFERADAFAGFGVAVIACCCGYLYRLENINRSALEQRRFLPTFTATQGRVSTHIT